MKEHKVHLYAKFHGTKASVLADIEWYFCTVYSSSDNHSQEGCTSRKQTISQKGNVYLKPNAAKYAIHFEHYV